MIFKIGLSCVFNFNKHWIFWKIHTKYFEILFKQWLLFLLAVRLNIRHAWSWSEQSTCTVFRHVQAECCGHSLWCISPHSLSPLGHYFFSHKGVTKIFAPSLTVCWLSNNMDRREYKWKHCENGENSQNQ